MKLAAEVSASIPKKSRDIPFALPFSEKRIRTMTDAERRGPVARYVVPHFRLCGYTPRPPRLGESDFSFEKILDHLESKHPASVYGTPREFGIVLAQRRGDDSACQF